MENRRQSELINIQPAENANILHIQQLWQDEGEHNVDVRSVGVVEAAIASGGLHTFTAKGHLVATGGFYSYADGTYTELGSSCWSTPYRGLGGAEVSICFRSVMASLYEPGTVVTSELYSSSVRSARVIARCGGVRLDRATFDMHEHAYQANPVDPVHHYIVPPWQLIGCAKKLLSWLDGSSSGPDGDLIYSFSRAYNLGHDGVRTAIEHLAGGDLEVIGHAGIRIGTPAEWLTRHTGEPLLNYDEFLIRRELVGVPAPSTDLPDWQS